MGSLGWSATFNLIPPFVLHSEISGHTQHDQETEALESDVDDTTLLVLWAFFRWEPAECSAESMYGWKTGRLIGILTGMRRLVIDIDLGRSTYPVLRLFGIGLASFRRSRLHRCQTRAIAIPHTQKDLLTDDYWNIGVSIMARSKRLFQNRNRPANTNTSERATYPAVTTQIQPKYLA